jgi:hypothetical protein
MLSRVEYRNEKGSFHRLDGPAIEYSDGDKWWYLNDTRYFSEQEYQNELIKLKLERLINI